MGKPPDSVQVIFPGVFFLCVAEGVEQIVGLAHGQGKLAHGDTRPGGDVDLAGVLHDPATLGELAVNILTRLIFRGHESTPNADQALPDAGRAAGRTTIETLKEMSIVS